MLRAVIRSDRDALHFFAEVNGYNLQTLRQRVRQTARERGRVHLSVEIDPYDQAAFAQYAGRWLPALSKAGSAVEVTVLGSPASVRRPAVAVRETGRSS